MLDRFTAEAEKMGGLPCIRGLRMPVSTVVGMVTDGMSFNAILAAYPDLVAEDIEQWLRYASYFTKDNEILLHRLL